MNKRNDNADKETELKFDLTLIVTEETGMNEMFASQIADALVRGLQRHFGGKDLYIPAPDKAKRDAAVKAAFTGNNRDEVLKKFRISKTTFYEIIGSR